jgi:DNA-binding transcriptional LysR family regulator
MEDRLQKFAALVDSGSFTKAADELHLSQPALSTAIAKLERELHATLILRGTRPLKLTSSGEAAYAHAKETAVRTSNLKLHIAHTAKRKLSLKIGMIDSLAEALFELGPGLNELEQQTNVSLVIDNSRNLTTAVARGDLDIAFVAAQPRQSNIITAQHIGAEPLVLVCHTDLLANIQAKIAHGSLPNFISYDQNSTTFQLIRHALATQHIKLKPTFYSTSPEVIRRLVLSKKGVAALPLLMVRDLIAQGELVAVVKPIARKVLPEPLVNLTIQLQLVLNTLNTGF